MELFDLDLGQFGASGFTLRDRLDMTGHPKGNVDPHINSDLVINQSDYVLRKVGNADYRDLCSNQLPGFNGMQKGE